MQKDQLVFDLIGKELARQRHGIELIASENFTSLQVMQAMGSVLTNKYAEGYPGRRYYGGCEIVDQAAKVAGIPAPSLADGALPYRDLHGNRHLFKGRHDESIIDYDTRFGMRGSECAISGNGSARSSF